MSLISEIDALHIKLDNLLPEFDKNKQAIESCFKEIKNLLSDLEGKAEQIVFEYYKYLFHCKNASYLKVLGKTETQTLKIKYV